MENQINKVNNLEELCKLKIGSKVLVADGGEMYALERIFEGNKGKVYSFLQYDLKYPQDRTLTTWKVIEENIYFKPHFNGAIKIMSHDCETYLPSSKEHSQKLNLINGVLK